MLRTLSALLITALLGLTLIGGTHPVGRLDRMDLTGAHGKSHLKVKTTATGLMPGISKRLKIKVTNPFRFRVKVVKVRIRVHSASRKCNAGNIRVTVRRKPFLIKPRRHAVNKKVARVKMRTNAANACQAARFPLKVTVKAVKGR